MLSTIIRYFLLICSSIENLVTYKLHEGSAAFTKKLYSTLGKFKHFYELRSRCILCNSFTLRYIVLVLILKLFSFNLICLTLPDQQGQVARNGFKKQKCKVKTDPLMFINSAVIRSYSCLIICSLFTMLNCVVDT